MNSDTMSIIPGLPSEIMFAFVALVGLLFGSFVTLAAHRIPRGIDVTFTRSRCPQCLHVLGVLDLMPLFSWIIQKGRCRYCHTQIHYRYPLIELTQSLLFVLVFWRMGLSIQAILVALLSVSLLIMIVVDFEHKIIPDSIQIAIAMLGIVYQLTTAGLTMHIVVGPMIGFGFAMALRMGMGWWKKQEALGLGDVKFFMVAGLFLTVELIIPFLLMTGVIGIITALVWEKLSEEKEFPFGPALAASLFFSLLVPESYNMIREYLLQLVAG